MDTLMNIIKGRRSVRKYEEKPVPDEHINQILESIRWAPSWGNTQCWEVVVVKDPANRNKIRDIVSEKNPARKAFTQAPVIFTLCAKLKVSGFYSGKSMTKLGDWFMFDMGLAAQNLCLAAHDLGLGTVIVGIFDHNRVKNIIGLGDDYEVVALVLLGYPAKDFPAPKRRDINDFAHYEVFKSKS